MKNCENFRINPIVPMVIPKQTSVSKFHLNSITHYMTLIKFIKYYNSYWIIFAFGKINYKGL